MTDETVNFLAVPTYVRQWRKLHKLTQAELGEKIGVSGSSISQLETGSQGFTDKTLADLAAVFQCSPIALLAHDPSREDSFWPLFEAAERLEGQDRRKAFKLIRAALDLDADAA
jgi:transcriptional regulator with XRE-family HTH domain